MPGIVITSAVFTFLWGYLVYTGNISTIWPLFGLSNQLLAACALIVCTTMLLRLNRGKYTLAVAIPALFAVFETLKEWGGRGRTEPQPAETSSAGRRRKNAK